MRAWKPNLSTFSKSTPGGVALNFSENASCNCWDGCPMKGEGCYGERIDKMKPSVRVSGTRKREAGFKACAEEYMAQLRSKMTVPWVRFSSFGSLPTITKAEEETALELLAVAAYAGPVHFPVESPAKYKFWSRLARPFGIVVRQSMHSMAKAYNRYCQGHNVSVVWKKGATLKERIKNAEEWAVEHRGAMVCPGISKGAKCGDTCIECSKPDKLIIYPQH